MSITRLTCKYCESEFDYDNQVRCQHCNEIIPCNTCIQCHNRKNHKDKSKQYSLALRYRNAGLGLMSLGIICYGHTIAEILQVVVK